MLSFYHGHLQEICDNVVAVRADHAHIRKRGCTEPGMSGVAQFGNGSVRDRKNGLLDGDVVEWEWAERQREREEKAREAIREHLLQH